MVWSRIHYDFYAKEQTWECKFILGHKILVHYSSLPSAVVVDSQTNKIPTWLLQNELTAHSPCARKFKILYLHVTWTYFHIISCLPDSFRLCPISLVYHREFVALKRSFVRVYASFISPTDMLIKL